MPVVLIHANGSQVVLPRQETTTTTAASTKSEPNPILPVGKEFAWGIGSFLILVILMRLWLYPALNKGTDARYAKIREDTDVAESTREAAAADEARYEAAIAQARSEANALIDAARREVEADRSAKMAAANARIAERRAEAAAETDASKQAAMGQVKEVVVEVASSAAERILGRPVDRDTVGPLVTEVVHAGVGS